MPFYDFCAEVSKKLPGQTVTGATAQDNSPLPPTPAGPYLMFAVAQDTTTNNQGQAQQPYTRGLGHVRQIQVTLGSGAGVYTYTQTIDTGSGLLNMACTTPKTQIKGCPGPYFTVTSANYGTAQQCAAIMAGASTGGAGCFQTACQWAQGLTGARGCVGRVVEKRGGDGGYEVFFFPSSHTTRANTSISQQAGPRST
jgi:hypothetical protein